jgi:hypothetical protein
MILLYVYHLIIYCISFCYDDTVSPYSMTYGMYAYCTAVFYLNLLLYRVLIDTYVLLRAGLLGSCSL